MLASQAVGRLLCFYGAQLSSSMRDDVREEFRDMCMCGTYCSLVSKVGTQCYSQPHLWRQILPFNCLCYQELQVLSCVLCEIR